VPFNPTVHPLKVFPVKRRHLVPELLLALRHLLSPLRHQVPVIPAPGADEQGRNR